MTVTRITNYKNKQCRNCGMNDCDCEQKIQHFRNYSKNIYLIHEELKNWWYNNQPRYKSIRTCVECGGGMLETHYLKKNNCVKCQIKKNTTIKEFDCGCFVWKTTRYIQCNFHKYYTNIKIVGAV